MQITKNNQIYKLTHMPLPSQCLDANGQQTALFIANVVNVDTGKHYKAVWDTIKTDNYNLFDIN